MCENTDLARTSQPKIYHFLVAPHRFRGTTYVSDVVTVLLKSDNLSRSDGRHGDWCVPTGPEESDR